MNSPGLNELAFISFYWSISLTEADISECTPALDWTGWRRTSTRSTGDTGTSRPSMRSWVSDTTAPASFCLLLRPRGESSLSLSRWKVMTTRMVLDDLSVRFCSFFLSSHQKLFHKHLLYVSIIRPFLFCFQYFQKPLSLPPFWKHKLWLVYYYWQSMTSLDCLTTKLTHLQACGVGTSTGIWSVWRNIRL